jgi:hypothetical protein
MTIEVALGVEMEHPVHTIPIIVLVIKFLKVKKCC